MKTYLLTAVIIASSFLSTHGDIKKPECIAPAKPGGGFDLTCKLFQSGLSDFELIKRPLKITYQPGGVGAITFNSVVSQKSKDENIVVAFGAGSILNLAQGKYGKNLGINDVKWLGSLGTDYGVIAVKNDSPIKNLKDLMEQIKKNPQSFSVAAGATVGGQDWLQTVLLFKSAGVSHETIRYVAFEGGGEALTAVLGGHVQLYSAGLAESITHHEAGTIRILAVFAKDRIPYDRFKNIPTAKEQGYDVTWEVVRGLYVPKNITNEQYNAWLKLFQTMEADPRFEQLQLNRGLIPFKSSGDAFTSYIAQLYTNYTELAKSYNLIEK